MFYSLPTKPEKNRLRIWRRLQKEGTLSLKDGVHILPYSDDRYELFVWLAQEIRTLGGDMSFVKVERVETIDDDQLITLFLRQAESSYLDLEKKVALLRSDWNARQTDEAHMRPLLKKLNRDYDELRSIDFFQSHKGRQIAHELRELEESVETSAGEDHDAKAVIPRCALDDYRNRIWQTRPKPFVDRMACAWLIQRFIDPDATWAFGESPVGGDSAVVTYDMQGGRFTHIGNFCTFEVMMQAFGLDDPALARIAKIVHTLDINDDKYHTPEAEGIQKVLAGIRHGCGEDGIMLRRGREVFDALYAAFGASAGGGDAKA